MGWSIWALAHAWLRTLDKARRRRGKGDGDTQPGAVVAEFERSAMAGRDCTHESQPET